MRILYNLLFGFLISISLLSCGHNDDTSPADPADPSKPETVTKPVMLWIDLSANFTKFLQPSGITDYLNKAKNAGITDVIVDVRPTSGEVMYPSQYAPQISSWKGVERDTSWDYLGVFITEAHKLGIKVHAAMNALTSGQNIMRRGPAYTDSKVASWTSKSYTELGVINLRDDNRGAVFINPCLKDAQDYVINIAKEIVSKYDIDGLIYDRCRFDNENADWNDESKAAFEKYVKDNYGREGIKFPSDIYTYDATGKKVYGIYRQVWYEWRASLIHDIFYKTRDAVKAIKPNIKFSTYTGAWYSTYYQEGSNWASKNYDPSSEFSDWADSRYKNTGFAEALDYHLAGMYYADIDGSGWWTISGAITNVKRINKGACPVIASLAPEKFPNNPEGFKRAIAVAMKNADGMMIFDLYHVEDMNYWNTIKEALNTLK